MQEPLSKNDALVEAYTIRYAATITRSKELKRKIKQYRTLSSSELLHVLEEITNAAHASEETVHCFTTIGIVDILLKILSSVVDEEVMDKTTGESIQICSLL